MPTWPGPSSGEALQDSLGGTGSIRPGSAATFVASQPLSFRNKSPIAYLADCPERVRKQRRRLLLSLPEHPPGAADMSINHAVPATSVVATALASAATATEVAETQPPGLARQDPSKLASAGASGAVAGFDALHPAGTQRPALPRQALSRMAPASASGAVTFLGTLRFFIFFRWLLDMQTCSAATSTAEPPCHTGVVPQLDRAIVDESQLVTVGADRRELVKDI